MTDEKLKRRKKKRYTSVKSLVMTLNSNERNLDQRTTQAKEIKQIKAAVRENLEETAQALLEADVAQAAVIQKMALEQAFKDPSKAIQPDGKPCYALNSWAKFANLKKSALLALKKFQPKEQQEDEEQSLAQVILEVSEEQV